MTSIVCLRFLVYLSFLDLVASRLSSTILSFSFIIMAFLVWLLFSFFIINLLVLMWFPNQHYGVLVPILYSLFWHPFGV